MRYEIDPTTFAVSIFDDGATVPFQFQPDYPNGDTFDSVAEATTWAELAVASFDPSQPYAPIGKGLVGEAKPVDVRASGITHALSLGFSQAQAEAMFP